MSDTNGPNENEIKDPNGKSSHGFLKFLVVILIIGALIFGLVKCAEYKSTVNSNTSQGVLYYSEARNRYYRYDEETGWLCICHDGVVHTLNIYTKKAFEKIKKQDKLHE